MTAGAFLWGALFTVALPPRGLPGVCLGCGVRLSIDSQQQLLRLVFKQSFTAVPKVCIGIMRGCRFT